MKKEVGDWTVGAKLNDEHVSEQEAERIAEVNALRAENEKLNAECVRLANTFIKAMRVSGYDRLIYACKSLHNAWKRERERVSNEEQVQCGMVDQTLDLAAENEKLKKQLEKAEALITDLSIYLTSMIEWMHGLPDSTQGVNRVEHQTRGIAQSVVVYMSRMRKRIGNGQSIGGINE